jgi:hypothetical protein
VWKGGTKYIGKNLENVCLTFFGFINHRIIVKCDAHVNIWIEKLRVTIVYYRLKSKNNFDSKKRTSVWY